LLQPGHSSTARRQSQIIFCRTFLDLPSGESAYIRGKAYSCIKDRTVDAEEWLSKAIKLETSKAEAWATLGDLAWRQGDAESASHYYNQSLRMKRTKEALRELSVIIRQPPKDGDSKGILDPSRIDESIALAKEAVQLDLDDHSSWYFLGQVYQLITASSL
jgi:tetratricopeptide (TPR) repeat protein